MEVVSSINYMHDVRILFLAVGAKRLHRWQCHHVSPHIGPGLILSTSKD